MKRCSKCGGMKTLANFHKDSSRAGGYSYWCKSCTVAAQKLYKKTPAGKLTNKKYDKSEKRIAFRRVYMGKRNLALSYGMTLDQYRRLFDEQHGVCAICGLPESSTFRGKVKSLCVDHDHSTGTVRGLLCQNCNLALGYLKDDVEVIASLVSYLKNSEEKICFPLT